LLWALGVIRGPRKVKDRKRGKRFVTRFRRMADETQHAKKNLRTARSVAGEKDGKGRG